MAATVRLAIALLCLIAIPVSAGEWIEGPARVRDGDTVVVAGQPVRLMGVAAPELSEPGGSASKATMRAITHGRVVACELTGARTYDRRVGICYIDGRDIGAEIIARGHARDCPRYSGGRYAALEINHALPLPGYCR